MTQSKHRSDVHFVVSIKALTNNGVVPDVAIATQGNDTTITDKQYASLEDLAVDYPENTNVYNQAEAMFDVSTFNNNLIEVIAYPNAPVATPSNVKVKATPDGAEVTADNTPGLVAGVKAHMWDGFKYLLLDNASEADIEALSDVLYDAQRVMLVIQPKSVDDLVKLQAHVATYQVKPNKLGNTAAIVDTSDVRFPAAQASAYAASNIPTDFMHIGKLSELEVDENLSDDDVDKINALNGIAVENKAGDNMLSQGKALAGNYIDQFVHAQLVIDGYTTFLQKYMNDHNFPAYTDKTILEMKAGLETLGTNYFTQNILAAKPVFDYVPRAKVMNSLVAEREYNGFSSDQQIQDDIETLNAKLNLTL